MGLLLNVIKTNALEDHPVLNLSHCINRNQKHLTCSACMDICPKGVYDRAQKALPKWDACQNCGLCVTACKSRCIAPSPANSKRHLLLAQKQGDVTISCTRAKKNGHIEECIALLPWEFLAYLALGGKLTLNLKSCKDCPHEDCLELLDDQLCRLKSFLGEARYAQHVLLRDDEEAQDSGVDVSRRDFLRSMTQGGKKMTALVYQDVAGSKVDAMVYRRLLTRRIRQIAAQEEFACTLPLPKIKEDCYGCGICALLCPHGALKVSDEENGLRSISISPYKCSGCGVCKAVCRDGNIEEIASMRVPHMDRVILTRVATASCEGCGRAMDPRKEERLCIICRQKKKK